MKVWHVLFVLNLTVFNASPAQSQKVTPYSASMFVTNIDSSIHWYTQILSLNLRNRTDNEERGFKQANVENDDMIIELVEVRSSISPAEALKDLPQASRVLGYYKIGFRVPDLDAWHNSLKTKNVEFYGQTVTDRISGKRTFLVKDPDGNVLQFFEK